MDKFGILHSDYPDIELSNQNIWQFLHPRLKKWDDLTAFVMCNTNESITYKELIEKSLRWAQELKRSFSKLPNPTVAFAMSNNIDCFPLILGSFAVGASVCPLRYDATEDLFSIMVKLTKPDVLVMEYCYFLQLRSVIAEAGINPKIYIRGPSTEGHYPDFRQILNCFELLPVDEAGLCDPAVVALKVFSSGTTGTPKCIVNSHKSIVNAMACLMYHPILPIHSADEAGQETIGGTLPLAHAFGLAYFTIFATYLGCKIAYMDGTDLEILCYLRKYKPSMIRMRSNTIASISQMDCAESMDNLKTILFTGSPFEVNEAFNLMNSKIKKKLFLQNCYGCSEVAAVTMTPVGQFCTNMTGKIIPNYKILFLDLKTSEPITSTHKLGQLLLKGPGLMNGYLNNPEATKDAVDSDGWYHSGDVGYFDEENCIKVVDRLADFITVNNDGRIVKVSPTEIEKIIKTHPKVADAGVTGVINGEDEVPRAFVIRKEMLTEEEIIKYVEVQAPKKMRLKGGVTFVNDLPRNNMGKLIRKFLKEKAMYRDN